MHEISVNCNDLLGIQTSIDEFKKTAIYLKQMRMNLQEKTILVGDIKKRQILLSNA